MSTRSSNQRLPFLLVALLLAGALLPARAESLASRLRHLAQRKEQVQDRLRQVKQQQRSATARLDVAERDLDATESRLRAARSRLAATRRDLATARADLRRLEKQLANHTKQVQAHMLALYRAGDSSYLNVVMQADSFSEFANRGRFVSAVVNQDKYILRRLDNLQEQCDAKRADLERRETAQVTLANQVRADQRRAQSRRGEIKEILNDADTKRAAAEAILAQMDSEMAAVRQMVRSGGGSRYSGVWSGYFTKPVDSYRFTSPFGWRMHPILHYRKFHQGVDLACPYGTPIHAADKGLVIAAGWRGAVSGNTVIISHGSGLTTCYCHMSSVAVSKGALVTRGQHLGNVGSTGRSTGPHLHFGALLNGEWVDPMGFTR